MATNPLLEQGTLPDFSQIKAQHAEPAIDTLLAENRDRIQQLLENRTGYTWNNFIAPMEALNERLVRTWSPIAHMNAVVNSDALRNAYNACLPKLSDYSTELGQNKALFQAYQGIAEHEDFAQLDTAQRKLINNTLRDFHLSGIDLPDKDKARYKTIMQSLSDLHARFEQNLLDATNTWHKHLADDSRLQGLPDSSLALMKQTATQHKQDGYRVTLEFPSYNAVMTYANDRALREEVYTAFVTRASDEGPDAGKWDNSDNMEQILSLRHEAALLLGFHNYAERSLATKMASSTTQVLEFLQDLANRSLTIAARELEELKRFAQQAHGLDDLEAWDVPYYSEKLKQQQFSISQEEIKPYFPADKVVSGMFEVVNNLYGLNIMEVPDIATWHKDVRYFEVRDNNNELRGTFYLDLYARPHKRGGAWMDECRLRMRTHETNITPVAFLTCNFTPPIGDQPALFTHQEVVTLFHEFGHGLHHMLTQIDHPGVSGINGVAWDAVELPSQFMENWCWEEEALPLFSGHYETGEALPREKFERLVAARNFQSGMQMLRQIEFALFDFKIHLQFDPQQGGRILETLEQVRKQIAVIKPPSFNRFPHSFAHIFASGYAAGYYSYKWAEVLSSDAFSLFEEKGIFDSDTGLKFMQAILEQGGSKEPMELFIDFRGREPQIDALLRHSGIAC